MAARAYALVVVAVMAAVTAIGAVGERQSQTEALPLQGAADGLGMSHQPAALFPSWYIAPWVPGDTTEDPMVFDFDAYHPGETIEPTPSVVQAATVRAAAVGGSLTEAEMIAVLYSAGWPEELHRRALEVSYCESRWSPYGAGDISNHPEQKGRALSRGLFQMGVSGYRWVNGAWSWWNGWFLYFGIDESLADDPVTNATVALWAYQRSGWGPWSCAR